MGSRSQTEYVARSSPPRVTVTRRHHPFEGKAFELVMGGAKMFVIRVDDKSTMRIPRTWTDADGARAGMDAPAHVFTADALRELGALVSSMRDGRRQNTRWFRHAPIAPQTPRATATAERDGSAILVVGFVARGERSAIGLTRRARARLEQCAEDRGRRDQRDPLRPSGGRFLRVQEAERSVPRRVAPRRVAPRRVAPRRVAPRRVAGVPTLGGPRVGGAVTAPEVASVVSLKGAHNRSQTRDACGSRGPA